MFPLKTNKCVFTSRWLRLFQEVLGLCLNPYSTVFSVSEQRGLIVNWRGHVLWEWSGHFVAPCMDIEKLVLGQHREVSTARICKLYLNCKFSPSLKIYQRNSPPTAWTTPLQHCDQLWPHFENHHLKITDSITMEFCALARISFLIWKCWQSSRYFLLRQQTKRWIQLIIQPCDDSVVTTTFLKFMQFLSRFPHGQEKWLNGQIKVNLYICWDLTLSRALCYEPYKQQDAAIS